MMMSFAALYTITPESYPTEIRNIGNGWANALARLGGLLAPLTAGPILDLSGGFSICLVLFSLLFGVAGIAGLMLKETKGRQDEEISAICNKSSF